MTERQLLLIRQSWSYVVFYPTEAGTMFYMKLCGTVPGISLIFPGDISEELPRIMNRLTLAITKFNDMPMFEQEVKSFAGFHQPYGLDKIYYRKAGECLLWVLQNGLQEKWDKETAAAWKQLFSLMAEGYERQSKQIVNPVLL